MVAARAQTTTPKTSTPSTPRPSDVLRKKRRRTVTPTAVNGSPIVKLGGVAKPLPLQVRTPIESSLNADMSHVRVHDDAQANKSSRQLGARAFTYGSNIYLGPQEKATDLRLIAHEAAHTVQQQRAPTVQMFPLVGSAPNSHEAEAQHAATAVVRGQSYTVQNRTGGATIQREGLLDRIGGAIAGGARRVGSAVVDTAGSVVEAAGDLAERGINWAREQAWGLVRRYAPRLEPIIRQGPRGVFNWIRERVVSGFQNLFNHFAAPLRAVQNFIGPVQTQFSNALVGMREAAAQIASGDCSSIVQAARTIQEVFHTITGPYIERLREFGTAARNFFNEIWGKISSAASEIWDTLSEYAGRAWQEIRDFFTWIWEQTRPMRDMILGPLGRAWEWIKQKLGIQEEVEGQGGIWNWIKGKVGDAWEGLKARVRPFKNKIYAALGIVAGILILLSPAGPFVILAGLVVGILVGIRWIQQNFAQPDSLVEQRGVLEGRIIPMIMDVVNAISARVQEGANSLADTLRNLLTEAGGLARTIGGTFLSFALSFIEWLLQKFRQLTQWATGVLVRVANWVETGLNRLRQYLQPLFTFLRRVGEILLDFFRVAEVVGGHIWNAIPACIRDPFVNFLVNQILARLPLFGEIVTIPGIWQRIRASAIGFIRQVFINGDLMAALVAIFRLILWALNVPVELITQIFQRADTIIDQLARNPLGFLRNMLATMSQALDLFFGNILTHLMNGALAWLFGQVSNIGIQRPADFSLRSILGLVMQILGLSVDFIWQRLGARIGRERAQRLRRMVDRVVGALVWLRDLVQEGPAGLWRHIQEQLSNLRDLVIGAITGWIQRTIVTRAMARLATMLDPTGIMAVVNTIISIYRGLQSLIDQMRPILEVINAFLGGLVNIGRGVIAEAAVSVEQAMGRAIGPMIAFLANQVGLGRIGRRIREVVMRIRQRVQRAVDWLIDRVVRGGQFLLNLGRSAVGAVREWWRNRRGFRGQDGNQHSFYFNRRGQSLIPMVSSTPVAVDSFLEQRETHANSLSDATQKQTLLNHVNQARTLLTQISQYTNPPTAPGPGATPQNVEGQVNPLINQLMTHLSALMTPGSTDHPVPRMVFTPGFSGSLAQSPTTARFIYNGQGNHDPGNLPQSGTNRQSVGILRALGISSNWVRFHILNENIGGKGVESNLIPMPRYINNPDYLTNFENHLKTRVEDNNEVVWMRATFTRYPDGIFIQNYTANGGSMTYNESQNRWVEDSSKNVPTYSRSNIDYPQADAIYINVLYLYETINPIAFSLAMRTTQLSENQVRLAFSYATRQGWTQFDGLDQFIFALVEGWTGADSYTTTLQRNANSTNFAWDTSLPEWGSDE